jgi:hypothetical protein
MANTTKVYLVVHELFGVLFKPPHHHEPGHHPEHHHHPITLVTPVVRHKCKDDDGQEHEHVYKIARFKQGTWVSEKPMQRDEHYTLCGVVPRTAVATNVPCHPEFSPHPPGNFKLNPAKKPYCTWRLPLPRNIHQLRTVSVRDADRPIFTGDPQGDEVDAQMNAVSLAQVFEYELESQERFGIFDSHNNRVDLDYSPDDKNSPPTINLHLWAQLENETDMSEECANEHARMATRALVELFEDLTMQGGQTSLSINDLYTTQTQMPVGVRFVELMTLAERFVLQRVHIDPKVFCTGKTCGHGGNLFVNG